MSHVHPNSNMNSTIYTRMCPESRYKLSLFLSYHSGKQFSGRCVDPQGSLRLLQGICEAKTIFILRHDLLFSVLTLGFPNGASGKEHPNTGNTRDTGSTPGWGRSLAREGHGNPLQHSCLENSMDRGAWQASVQRIAKSQTRLSDSAHTHMLILALMIQKQTWWYKANILHPDP